MTRVATDKGAYSKLAKPGQVLAVRVTPRAARNSLKFESDVFKILVTTVPENGKATKAAQKSLARALGVAPSRLVLIRGTTSRDKVFRLD